MKLRSERSEIIALVKPVERYMKRTNPKGVECETTFRAERDNSFSETCGA
jgi:hypothetical protein